MNKKEVVPLTKQLYYITEYGGFDRTISALNAFSKSFLLNLVDEFSLYRNCHCVYILMDSLVRVSNVSIAFTVNYT